MIDGVTILAQKSRYGTVYSWGWSWEGFFLAILSAIILVIIIYLAWYGIEEGLIFLVFLGALVPISLDFFSKGNSEEIYLGEQYKVIIDDSVSLNEFNEKYDIIEQEGEIYTIILKDME